MISAPRLLKITLYSNVCFAAVAVAYASTYIKRYLLLFSSVASVSMLGTTSPATLIPPTPLNLTDISFTNTSSPV